MRFNKEGHLEVLSGGVEYGQGLINVVAQIAAGCQNATNDEKKRTPLGQACAPPADASTYLPDRTLADGSREVHVDALGELRRDALLQRP